MKITKIKAFDINESIKYTITRIKEDIKDIERRLNNLRRRKKKIGFKLNLLKDKRELKKLLIHYNSLANYNPNFLRVLENTKISPTKRQSIFRIPL